MWKQYNLSALIPQIFAAIRILLETGPFIKANKLWKGFFEYKWIALLTIILSILFSYYFISGVFEYFSTTELPTKELAENLDEEGLEELKKGGKRVLMSSGTKYLLLIILEVIIFFFSVRTLNILNNRERTPAYQEFVNAEKRMILVMFLSFIKTAIISLLLNIFMSILGLKFAIPFVLFFVHAYFIGYAFLDNYLEQFEISVKDTEFYINQHTGAVLTFGMVSTLLFYIPLAGPLLSPIFLAVAATIYAFEVKMENTEIILTEKQQMKREKRLAKKMEKDAKRKAKKEAKIAKKKS